MERLGSEVRRELDRLGPAAAIGDVVEAWVDAVGLAIATNAWPARVARDGTLHVNTADSVWAFELGHQAAEICDRLRAKLGESAPKAVRFSAGLLPSTAEADPADEPRARLVPTPEEASRAAEIASAIGDEELRERVAAAVATSLARTAAGRSFW